MDINESNILAGQFLKVLTSQILDEVIKADMSMHHEQIKLWKDFGENRPFGNSINPDIHIGFAEERYLCLNEVRLTFHIRRIPASVYYNVRNFVKKRFGFTNLPVRAPVMFDICSPNSRRAMAMNIIVKRFENGTVSADYGPVDDKTGELMGGGNR
jgi:hypothetical protein